MISCILLKRKHHFAKHATPFTLLDISFFERYLGENVRLIRVPEIKYLHKWINNVITR